MSKVAILWNKCRNHPGRDTRSRTGNECSECIQKRSDSRRSRERLPDGSFASDGNQVTHKSRGLQNQVHKVFRNIGELPKPKEALCLTCFGLPHAVSGVYCMSKKTDGSICGQSSEPESIEVKGQGIKSNFLVNHYE